MAEGGDDVLSIKVVGDFSDFDEGIAQREASVPRQVTLGGGSSTFANETGARQSPALSYSNFGPFDTSRALPGPGQSVFGAQGSGAASIQGSLDRLIAAMERAAASMAGLPSSGRTYDLPGPGGDVESPSFSRGTGGRLNPAFAHRFAPGPRNYSSDYYARRASMGGGSSEQGLVRYLPPTQRGGGPDEVIDAEYEPASQLGAYGGGMGGGAGVGTGYGGNALPPPPPGTAMVPPFGPQAGGYGGGGGNWRNFPPYRPYPNPRRPGGNGAFWNQNVMPHSMFFNLMFGAFEVARSFQAQERGINMEGAADNTEQVLRAQLESVQGSSRGIFGSIGGLVLDAGYNAGLVKDSPFSVERSLISLEGVTRFQEEAGEMGRGNMRAGRMQAAIGKGTTVMEMTRLENQAQAENEKLEARRGFIMSQLGARVNTGTGWSRVHTADGDFLEFSTNRSEPLIKDETQRAAMGADVKFLTDRIASNNKDVVIAKGERDKDLAQGMMSLTARGQDAQASMTLSPGEAARTNLLRQQMLEFSATARTSPELIPNLSDTQRKEYDALVWHDAQSNLSLDIGSAGRVSASLLAIGRRPYEASRALMRSNYSAAMASPDVVHDPAAQARLTNELVANLSLSKSQHDFDMHSAIQGFDGSIRAKDMLLMDRPKDAARESIINKAQMDVRNLPLDAPDSLVDRIGSDAQKDLDLVDKKYAQSQGFHSASLYGRNLQLNAGFNRDPAGAAAFGVATSTQDEIVRSRLAQEDPVMAQAAARTGQRQIELQKRDYLESFRGVQLDLRDFRVDNPRDRENPAATVKTMDEAISIISETLAGNNDVFFQKMAAAVADIVAK